MADKKQETIEDVVRKIRNEIAELRKVSPNVPSVAADWWEARADGALKFDGPLPAEWFYDLTPLGANARRAWLIKSNVQSGEWDAEKLLALYDRDELGELMAAA